MYFSSDDDADRQQGTRGRPICEDDEVRPGTPPVKQEPVSGDDTDGSSSFSAPSGRGNQDDDVIVAQAPSHVAPQAPVAVPQSACVVITPPAPKPKSGQMFQGLSGPSGHASKGRGNAKGNNQPHGPVVTGVSVIDIDGVQVTSYLPQGTTKGSARKGKWVRRNTHTAHTAHITLAYWKGVQRGKGVLITKNNICMAHSATGHCTRGDGAGGCNFFHGPLGGVMSNLAGSRDGDVRQIGMVNPDNLPNDARDSLYLDLTQADEQRVLRAQHLERLKSEHQKRAVAAQASADYEEQMASMMATVNPPLRQHARQALLGDYAHQPNISSSMSQAVPDNPQVRENMRPIPKVKVEEGSDNSGSVSSGISLKRGKRKRPKRRSSKKDDHESSRERSRDRDRDGDRDRDRARDSSRSKSRSSKSRNRDSARDSSRGKSRSSSSFSRYIPSANSAN
jgi:hypothetical protein